MAKPSPLGFKMTFIFHQQPIFFWLLNGLICPEMQRNFFTLVTPPPPRPGPAKRFFSDFFAMFKYFQLFKGEKWLFSQKSPIGGPESKKYYLSFFHQIVGGGGTLLMEIFHQKIFLIIYPFPKYVGIKYVGLQFHSIYIRDVHSERLFSISGILSENRRCQISPVKFI